jgi:hypothetical protein
MSVSLRPAGRSAYPWMYILSSSLLLGDVSSPVSSTHTVTMTEISSGMEFREHRPPQVKMLGISGQNPLNMPLRCSRREWANNSLFEFTRAIHHSEGWKAVNKQSQIVHTKCISFISPCIIITCPTLLLLQSYPYPTEYLYCSRHCFLSCFSPHTRSVFVAHTTTAQHRDFESLQCRPCTSDAAEPDAHRRARAPGL